MENLDFEEELIDFYNVLYSNLKKKTQLKINSAFITLIQANHNTVLSIIKDSAIPPGTISPLILQGLVDKKMIKKNFEGDGYIITARGIWTVEKSKDIINELNLVDYFDETKFSIKYDGISEKINKEYIREQITLFGLISARAFSKESCVNLQSKFNLKDYWKEILDKSSQKLVELKIITENEKMTLYSRAKYEDPVPSLFTRLPKLMQYTKLIYNFDGDLHYWLEMPESDEIFIEKLAGLFSLIFKDKLNYENLDPIYEFCCEISYTMSVYVFNSEIHTFSTPKYDKLLKDALLKCIKDYT
jgi:hypothetical protein